jgi:MoaA/NifB/PqqE/SkfB family radical SAM enzyme
LVNTELDLEFFKRNFTPDFVLNHVEKITFCGDDGDPIYAHDLVAVIRYIKSIKSVEIVIVTNGSYKKSSWWQELGSVLTDIDTVHFSIDGWNNESNNLYRVNSDFASIMEGVTVLQSASACRLIWASIVFKFNENYLDRIVDMAQSYKFDAVQFTKSTKFGSVYPNYGSNDPLEPSDKFVSDSYRFARELVLISSRGLTVGVNRTNVRLYKSATETNGVKPLCEIGNKGLYIDAQGRLFPCCWVANRYTHNQDWQNFANQFDLHNTTLASAVTDPFWDNQFRSFKWQECQTKCVASRVDEKYATEW